MTRRRSVGLINRLTLDSFVRPSMLENNSVDFTIVQAAILYGSEHLDVDHSNLDFSPSHCLRHRLNQSFHAGCQTSMFNSSPFTIRSTLNKSPRPSNHIFKRKNICNPDPIHFTFTLTTASQ